MRGIIVGGGAGGAQDPKGYVYQPVYFDANGEVQVVTKLGTPRDTTTSPVTEELKLNLYGDVTGNVTGNADTVTHTAGNSFYVAGYSDGSNTLKYNRSVVVNSSNRLVGAAWNDFAEFRQCSAPAGFCVSESGSGELVKTTKRLQKVCYITSDTYGMIIGPNEKGNQAVAVAGRVLAYSDEALKVGDVVCSGKDGKISKMNRLEIILFPDRIVGEISEIPTYEEWNDIKVNNRYWVKVR